MRFYFEVPNRARLLGTQIGVVFAASVGIAGAATFLLPYLLPEAAPYLRLAVWATFFQVMSVLPSAVLQMEERPMAFFLFNAGGYLLWMLLGTILVVGFKWGGLGFLWAYILCGLALTGYSFGMVFRRAEFRVDFPMIKLSFDYAAPLLLNAVLWWGLDMADRLILSRAAGVEEVGYYTLAVQAGTGLSLLSLSFHMGIMPTLFRGDKTDERLNQAVSRYLTAVLIAYTVGILIANPILHIVGGGKWHRVEPLFPLALTAGLFQAFAILPIAWLQREARPRAIPVLTTLSLGVLLIGDYFLIPLFGAFGAALARCLCFLSLLLFSLWASQRRVGFQWDSQRLCAGLVLAIIILLCKAWIPI